MWKECGLPVENAGDSQALIQLKKGILRQEGMPEVQDRLRIPKR